MINRLDQILLEKSNYKLQLIIKGDKGELRFQSPDDQVTICNDWLFYIIDTLVMSIDAIELNKSECFDLKLDTPLGKLYNTYSFKLGHSDNILLTDPTENYLVFGDESCLFFYKIGNRYFIEIASIYNHINDLDIEYNTFSNWLKEDFSSITISVELNDLKNLRTKLKCIRPTTDASL